MKKIIQPPVQLKDANGSYIKAPQEPPLAVPHLKELSIDKLMERGLKTIECTMKAILEEALTGNPSREAIMNLKDCMAMLEVLKKRESEVLDSLSDDELKKLARE